MVVRVVCGLSETMASFSPISAFNSVDLPALGRPISEANPDRNAVISGFRARFRAPPWTLALALLSTRPRPALPTGCRRAQSLLRCAARAPAIRSPDLRWLWIQFHPAAGTPADRA